MKDLGCNTKECFNVALTATVNFEKYAKELFTATAKTFRFTADEQKKFENNSIAHLMVAIPFVAGCDDAQRTALAHLAMYITDLRGGGDIFSHTTADNESVFSRLRLISSFKGGNTAIIHHGMTLLALVMLKGYEASKDYDQEHSQYNPLNEAVWNYTELHHSLTTDIIENPCIPLDTILPLDTMVAGW